MKKKDIPSNAFAKKYLDIAEVMFIVIDANQKVSLINKKCCKVLEYKEDEIIGKNWFDNFLPENIRNDVKKVFEELIAGKLDLVEYYENPVLTKSGKEKIIAWHNTVLKDESGRIISTLSSGEDITDRKQVEIKIKENERFLIDVLSSIQDGISILDSEMNIIRVNPPMERWYSHAMPLIGKKCYKAYHGRSEICNDCPSYKTLKSGISCYNVVPKTGPDGKLLGWFDLYSFPFVDASTGEIKGVIEYVRDITERTKTEQEIKSIAKFPSENPNPVLRISKDKKVMYKNEAFDTLLRESGFSEKDMYKILPENLNTIIDETLERKQPCLLVEIDVSGKVFSYNIIPIPEHGYVNMYGRDITERKRIERDLEKRIKELEDFYEMAVGRELRMKELKEKVKSLEAELSKYKKS